MFPLGLVTIFLALQCCSFTTRENDELRQPSIKKIPNLKRIDQLKSNEMARCGVPT